MKKIYTFLSVVAATVAVNAQSQNLVVNPGFESWVGEVPTAYDPYTGPNGSPSINNFVAQESNIKHGGEFSLRHTSQSGTQYLEGEEIPVVPGNSYTISYWFLDNDDAAASRMWSAWLNSEYSPLSDAINAEIRVDEYSKNNPEWVPQTFTVTAPAGAAFLRFQVRTYKQTNTSFGGFIYYDDFSVIDNSVNSVGKNEISDLKMFPNPLNGNVLNITSATGAEKAVAVFDVLGKQVFSGATTNNVVTLNNLTTGIYIVKMTEEGKTATRKLVVK